jgi:hypothetical protein
MCNFGSQDFAERCVEEVEVLTSSALAIFRLRMFTAL